MGKYYLPDKILSITENCILVQNNYSCQLNGVWDSLFLVSSCDQHNNKGLPHFWIHLTDQAIEAQIKKARLHVILTLHHYI